MVIISKLVVVVLMQKEPVSNTGAAEKDTQNSELERSEPVRSIYAKPRLMSDAVAYDNK